MQLVYVVRDFRAPPWLSENGKEQASDQRKRWRLSNKSGPRCRGLKSECLVLVGDPADEIAALAATGPASVVAMMLRSEDRLFLRRGAVAYGV